MRTNKDRVSYKFPKQCTLIHAADFQSIFQGGKKLKTPYLSLFAKQNGLSHPRLGLVVSKRAVKLAVKRNQVKRIARESFRHQQCLTGFDTLILVHPAINNLSKQDLRNFLDTQWQKLILLFEK